MVLIHISTAGTRVSNGYCHNSNVAYVDALLLTYT